MFKLKYFEIFLPFAQPGSVIIFVVVVVPIIVATVGVVVSGIIASCAVNGEIF